jgi:hypothetical protein
MWSDDLVLDINPPPPMSLNKEMALKFLYRVKPALLEQVGWMVGNVGDERNLFRGINQLNSYFSNLWYCGTFHLQLMAKRAYYDYGIDIVIADTDELVLRIDFQ